MVICDFEFKVHSIGDAVVFFTPYFYMEFICLKHGFVFFSSCKINTGLAEQVVFPCLACEKAGWTTVVPFFTAALSCWQVLGRFLVAVLGFFKFVLSLVSFCFLDSF